MLCQSCGQTEAVVRFTDIVNGEKRQLWLCPACVQTKGVVLEPSVFTVSPGAIPPSVEQLITPVIEALKGSVHPATQSARDSTATCPECGISFAEFKKRGRLGCAHDYVAFEDDMKILLEKIHGRCDHRGRIPATVRERRAVRQRVEALRKELEQAVKDENYELAANLRDRLRDLDQGDGGGDV